MSLDPNRQPSHVTRTGGSSLDEINLLDHLPILLTRWKFIVVRTVAVAILSLLVVLLIGNRYTAETVVLPPGNSSINSSLAGQLGGSGVLASAAGAGLSLKNPGDLFVSLFRSRTVEDAVVGRFKLAERYRKSKLSVARTSFEHNSSVELGTKDGLIRIDVTDRDPKLAAAIANGYVEEFQRFSADFAVTEASQRRLFFQEQLRDANNGLLSAEEAMKGTERSTGVVQIDSQTRTLVETAATLRAQIVAKEVQLEGMRSYATENNPDMLGTKQQITELQRQLSKLTDDNENTVSGLILPKEKVSEARLEYLRRYRDVKYYETISDIVARQFEIAKLDEARQGTVTQVVDFASVPDKPSYPKRGLIVFIAAMASFLILCAWCIYSSAIGNLGLPNESNAEIALSDSKP